MINRRRFITGAGLSIFLDALPELKLFNDHANSAVSNSVVKLTGRAFGTTWQLTLPHDTPANKVIEVCNASIDKINNALSPWYKHSEISTFNTRHSTRWMPVSSCCSKVIESALQVASLSNGYFDPTVGPIVGRVGFGPILRANELPDYKQIQVRQNAIRKSQPSLTLDPCGIAKGYALDLIVRELLKLGEPDHFLEIGGEIRASGYHPSGREWIAGIESPIHDNSKPAKYIRLKDKALATSSIKHNSYKANGKVISHIIDPILKIPIDNPLLSVSVIANTAMLADGWATAMLAAGDAHAMELAHICGLPSMSMITDSENTIRTVYTADFESYMI